MSGEENMVLSHIQASGNEGPLECTPEILATQLLIVQVYGRNIWREKRNCIRPWLIAVWNHSCRNNSSSLWKRSRWVSDRFSAAISSQQPENSIQPERYTCYTIYNRQSKLQVDPGTRIMSSTSSSSSYSPVHVYITSKIVYESIRSLRHALSDIQYCRVSQNQSDPKIILFIPSHCFR